MANIVELNQMSRDKLEKTLEEAREEMFNLRFQVASARLENTARLRQVRRQIAQVETVLHQRDLVTDAAVAEPAIAQLLDGNEWQAHARFIYEDSAWQVEFNDKSGKKLATAWVNLNKARPKGRAAQQAQMVIRHEVAR
ncbi:MAG: 50S ribosomal protein L29 [Anaerolineales bacterium]|uniref:50S ribosomal protein L29 n=1 Tax=Promineifilum sp. TaxID=2664178 RepID=UPI001D31383F|nr:50S ribosomal protein L29 [Anaerolineales bacterium]MCB8936274.1 50S ribosomal protein L29 [Promineifilum sp.]MCO5180193.1 50S ribosomal protein L29 [Promineifilum sp.]